MTQTLTADQVSILSKFTKYSKVFVYHWNLQESNNQYIPVMPVITLSCVC